MMLVHAEATNNRPWDPYQELANAVIKQAADDYRAIAGRLKTIGSIAEKQRLVQEMELIRQFFLDDWYEMLSNCSNGPMILHTLDKEVYRND